MPGGQRAEVDAAEADLESQVADYGHALLESLAEVESALVAIASARERLCELDNAVRESETFFDQPNAL